MFNVAQRIIIRNLCRKYLNDLASTESELGNYITITNDEGEELTLSKEDIMETVNLEIELFTRILKQPTHLLSHLGNKSNVSDWKHIMVNYTSILEIDNPLIGNIWHKVCTYERTLEHLN